MEGKGVSVPEDTRTMPSLGTARPADSSGEQAARAQPVRPEDPRSSPSGRGPTQAALSTRETTSSAHPEGPPAGVGLERGRGVCVADIPAESGKPRSGQREDGRRGDVGPRAQRALLRGLSDRVSERIRRLVAPTRALPDRPLQGETACRHQLPETQSVDVPRTRIRRLLPVSRS